MLIREFYTKREDGVNLYRTYSDIDMMIRQIHTGNLYSEAIDIENAPYTYEETDIPINPPEPEPEEEATEEDYIEALNRLGVDTNE